MNANGPAGKQLIMDSLRHWCACAHEHSHFCTRMHALLTLSLPVFRTAPRVTEYHVDGFRFDLASALTRRPVDGTPLEAPPLIRDIAKDAVLAKTKLIAEPWDCGGLYQVGSFPNWDRWGEWNGKYRDVVRKFVRGAPGQKAPFATRVSGSADMYAVNKRRPYHSLNFITAHDGFSLYDLVAYNSKRNGANGESNNDGSNDNESWNCGAEGATGDEGVNALRARQMRNFHLARPPALCCIPARMRR